MNSNQVPVNSLLEETESIAQGVLESVQAAVGTMSCKGVQVTRLAECAKQKGYRIEDVSRLGTFEDRGFENDYCNTSSLVSQVEAIDKGNHFTFNTYPFL